MFVWTKTPSQKVLFGCVAPGRQILESSVKAGMQGNGQPPQGNAPPPEEQKYNPDPSFKLGQASEVSVMYSQIILQLESIQNSINTIYGSMHSRKKMDLDKLQLMKITDSVNGIYANALKELAEIEQDANNQLEIVKGRIDEIRKLLEKMEAGVKSITNKLTHCVVHLKHDLKRKFKFSPDLASFASFRRKIEELCGIDGVILGSENNVIESNDELTIELEETISSHKKVLHVRYVQVVRKSKSKKGKTAEEEMDNEEYLESEQGMDLDKACRKGLWTKDEEALFADGVRECGWKHWAEIASMIPTRNRHQVREFSRHGGAKYEPFTLSLEISEAVSTEVLADQVANDGVDAGEAAD